MASKMRRRVALRRKIQILRALTKSKSAIKGSIIADASLYIHKLKLQVEAIKRERLCLIDSIQEVKVEELGTRYLKVMVTCKKHENVLVSILEAFENLDMEVVHARVNTGDLLFGMEAVVEAKSVDATILSKAVLKVVQTQT